MRKLGIAVLATLAIASAALVSCNESRAPAHESAAPARESSAPSGGTPVPATDIPSCTRIIGYSQTRQWYLASFETVVPDANFELFWSGGAGIRRWASSDDWDSGNLESPCATGAPARIVIDVGVGVEGLGDVNGYASSIRDAVQMARTRFPDAQIGLEPIVGGPGYQDCSIVYQGSTYDVNASVAAPYVAQAIDQVIAEDPTIFRGPDPQVASCDMYRDQLGHLTITTRDGSEPGQVYVGRMIGEFYAGAGKS